jgi:hypothetical protein
MNGRLAAYSVGWVEHRPVYATFLLDLLPKKENFPETAIFFAKKLHAGDTSDLWETAGAGRMCIFGETCDEVLRLI